MKYSSRTYEQGAGNLWGQGGGGDTDQERSGLIVNPVGHTRVYLRELALTGASSLLVVFPII